MKEKERECVCEQSLLVSRFKRYRCYCEFNVAFVQCGGVYYGECVIITVIIISGTLVGLLCDIIGDIRRRF